MGNAASGDQGWDYGDGGRNEIARAEHLKVAVDLRIHSRAIENRIARTIHLHLRNRERIANNLLRKSLHICALMRRDAQTLW